MQLNETAVGEKSSHLRIKKLRTLCLNVAYLHLVAMKVVIFVSNKKDYLVVPVLLKQKGNISALDNVMLAPLWWNADESKYLLPTRKPEYRENFFI